MSSLSSEFSASGEYLSEKAVQEKPSFSQTCNLLSHYLKQKGSFGDFGLGMSFGNGRDMSMNNDKTMDLFPNPGEVSKRQAGRQACETTASMNLFPQHSGFGTSVSKEEVVPNKADRSVNKPEKEVAQMTIFYNGQVMVFDDMSKEVAKEITDFASRASYQDPSIFPSAPIHKPNENTHKTLGMNLVNNMFIERLANDLPMSRKASLTRFLEKRKDRISARAPYQKSYSKESPPKENKKSWLGLSPQQYQNSS